MSLARVQHVCFDKDGVLTCVHAYWAHGSRLRAALLVERLGLDPELTARLLEGMGIDARTDRIKQGGPIGYHPRAVIVARVREELARAGVEVSDDAIAEVFLEVDRRQQQADDYQVVLLAGVRELLAELRRRAIVATVYSSDRRENIRRVLDRLELGGAFATLVGGDGVERPKPDPEGFLLACEQVGIEPDRSAYVGDTVSDLRMASDGGACATIGVATGLASREQLAAHTPHAFNDLTEVSL